MSTRETSQTLSRGLTVLTLVADAPNGMSISALTTELSISRTIIYRLASTLIDHRLLRRHGAGMLRIGLEALRPSRNVAPALRIAAHPILEALAKDLRATAHLVVAERNEVLAVAVGEPKMTVFQVAYRAGSRTPLGDGALGKAVEAAVRGSGGIFTSTDALH